MKPLISYASSSITPEQINSEISETLRQARTDGQLREEIAALGLDLANLSEGEEPVLAADVRESGLDPLTGGVLITFGVRFGYKVANDLWSRIILPRLERRFGVGSLEEPERPAAG